jgi:hypothetical protein
MGLSSSSTSSPACASFLHSSDDDVRAELEKHLGAGEEMPGEHIRMFARLLSHNAGLVDKEWANDQQSHWNISTETKEETRISFFVPCLRPRFECVFDLIFLCRQF